MVPLAGSIALFIAASEYLSLRALEPRDPDSSLFQLQASQPWGGFAAQELARGLYGDPTLDPRSAEPVLAWQLARSPLNPWRWLDRAELAYAAGEDWARVLWHLDAAVAVQPEDRSLRWEAAEFARKTRHFAVAEEHLRHWLQNNPGGTSRALRAAADWIADPDSRLTRILPEGEPFLEAALEFARRERDMNMAMVVWDRLERPRTPEDRALLDFVDLALATGKHGLAAEAWAESFSDYRPGQVPNADFQHAFGPARALHWHTRMPRGTRVTRDPNQFVTEPASLQVSFDGSENPHLQQPSISIPVDPEIGRWKIFGSWRGEALTTRSLPYVSVSAQGAVPARADIPASNFDWTPFTLEIDIPKGTTLLTLQLRRDALSREFDRYIAGDLWLDAIRISPIPTTPSPP